MGTKKDNVSQETIRPRYLILFYFLVAVCLSLSSSLLWDFQSPKTENQKQNKIQVKFKMKKTLLLSGF
jgi:hypothetical protein